LEPACGWIGSTLVPTKEKKKKGGGGGGGGGKKGTLTAKCWGVNHGEA